MLIFTSSSSCATVCLRWCVCVCPSVYAQGVHDVCTCVKIEVYRLPVATKALDCSQARSRAVHGLLSSHTPKKSRAQLRFRLLNTSHQIVQGHRNRLICDIERNWKLLRCTTLSRAASPPQYCRSTAFLTSSPRKTNSRRRTCSTKFDSAVLLVVLVVIVEAEAEAVSTSAAAPPS